jgi:predicted PurR-regulated permease PerM
MNSSREDVGEATTTLPDPQAAASQKIFFARVGMLLLAAGLLYLVWRIVTPLWQPVTWAILLGVLLAPTTARLAARLGNRPRLASSLMTVAVVLLLLLPLLAIGGAVAAQAAQLVNRIDASSLSASDLDLSDFPVLAGPLNWLDSTVGLSLAQIEDWVVLGAKRLLEIVAASGGAVFLGALGTIASFVLMLFVLFFMLRDGPRIAQTIVRMLPIETHLRAKLWRHLLDVTRAVFMGIGLTALVQGTLLGIGFAIAGLPSPLVFGVLGALFALVPIVGTALVWLPATLWLLSQDQPYFALFMLAWGVVVVGAVDNVLRPILISGRTEVPTLAVFIGVMGGLSAFGFIGLFLGPIVLGLLVALFRFTSDELAPGSNEA